MPVDEVARRRARAVGHPSVFTDAEPVPPDGGHDTYSILTPLEQRVLGARAAYRAAQEQHRKMQHDLGPGGRTLDREHLAVSEQRVQAAQDRLDAASDRLAAATELHRMRRDGLTGALQRDFGQMRLQQELERSQRDGTALVFAFLDLDALKLINDRSGHAAGDDALRCLGRALSQSLRSYDVVVRFGGDEFVCALPGLTVAQAAVRLRQVKGTLTELCPGTSVSSGLAAALPGDTVAAALARADADMYAQRRRDHPDLPAASPLADPCDGPTGPSS